MTKIGSKGEALVAPDSELVERAAPRRYTWVYKLGIVREADACAEPGEVDARRRSEARYTSHLPDWREQYDAGALTKSGRPRGRTPAERRDRENARLLTRGERAESELAKARKLSQSRPDPLGL